MEKAGNSVTRILFWFWVVLLLLWVVFFPLSAMVFDGGYTTATYVFFWSVAIYPITVIAAALTRKKVPGLVFLPFLSIAGALVSDPFHP